MKKAPTPDCEKKRLEALESYEILDTDYENVFDELTKLASLICETPIALVSLIDKDRQWFKSHHGIDARETPRDISYCGHAIMLDEVLIVENADLDERFADNPLNIQAPHVKFYAGVPLKDAEGYCLGTLCIIDHKPRKMSAEKIEALKALASNVVSLLNLRRKNIELNRLKSQFEEVEKMSLTGGWELILEQSRVIWSDEVYRIYGVEVGIETSLVDGINYYVGDSKEKIENYISRCATFGESFNDVFQFKDMAGNLKWVRSVGRAAKDREGNIVKIIGTFQDITQYIKTENRLNEINHYLDLSLDSANLGLWEQNLVTKELKYDVRWAGMLGLEVEEIGNTLSTWSDRVHPDDIEVTKSLLNDFIKNKVDKYKSVHRMKHANGRWVYILSQAVIAEKDSEGKPLKLVGTHTDITEIKNKEIIEEKIEKIREKYIASGGDYKDFFTFTLNKFMSLCLAQVGALVSYDSNKNTYDYICRLGDENILNVNNIDVIYNAILSSDDHYINDYSEEESLQLENYKYIGVPLFKSNDNGLFFILAGNEQLYDFAFYEFLFPIIQVISEMIAYIKLEQEKNEKEYERDIILESTGVAIWSYFPLEKKLEWDKSMYNLWGIEPGQFESHTRAWESLVHPEDIEKAYEEFIDTIKYRDKYETSFRIITPSGELKHIKAKANIIRNEAGYAVKLLGVNWDSTKDLKIQNELIIAKEKAESSEQAKTEFLANMSHEIRTPMNAILGMVSLMSDTELDEEQLDMIEVIESSGDILMGVLNDILDISKIEVGKLTFENKSFIIRDNVSQLISLFSNKASEKSITLSSTIDENVPKYLVGDITRIKQILMNFISNAIKFTKKGAININVSGEKLSSDKFEIVLAVKDTGIGIKKDSHSKIFESFTQADSSTTRKYGGTGLGLSICAKLAKMMGAEVIFDSKYGKGSTFGLKIVLKVGCKSEGTIIDRKIHMSSSEEFSKNHPHQILLVEDNLVNQKIASMLLKKMGYTCDIANNGKEAVDIVSDKGPEFYSLILMDMQMPIMDGVTSTKQILKQFGDSAPSIVAMTANVLEEDKQRCFDAGMVDFLSKPLKLDEFKRVLIRKF